MAQIFADIRTPFINETTLKRNLASRVRENIFQGIIVRPEEGVTEQFSTDTDAAEIQVIRVKPNDKQAREIGADINGGYFNNEEAIQPTTEAYGIRIITTIDHNIDLPTNQQDMINVDLAEKELQNLSGKVSKNVNAISLASQIGKKINALLKLPADSDADDVRIVTIDSTSSEKGLYKNSIIDAGAHLDNGNEEQGIETYPTENRAVYMRSSMKAALLKNGEIIIGGSNSAQVIVKQGGLDINTRPDNIHGYLGEVDNTPCYFVSGPVWKLIERYLALPDGALDNVLAVMVSGIGTGRALAFNNTVKIIDTPQGQGRRIQPKYRMGCECWDDKSVVLIVKDSFNPPEMDLTLKAPASVRFKITYELNGGTGTKPTDTKAYTYKEDAELSAGTGLAKGTKDIASWNTRSDGKGKTYALEDEIKVTGNLKLYAIYAE